MTLTRKISDIYRHNDRWDCHGDEAPPQQRARAWAPSGIYFGGFMKADLAAVVQNRPRRWSISERRVSSRARSRLGWCAS